MKGWNWRTKERMPNGELLTPREDVEAEWEPFFTPALIIVIIAMITTYIGWVMFGPGFSTSPITEDGHSHSHAGGAPLSAAESKAFAEELGITNADIKGPYTIYDGVLGSPASFGRGTSYLYGVANGGQRKDSLMYVVDNFPDAAGAREYAYGCGRGWFTATASWGFPKRLETWCNLNFHQTGQVAADRTRWGPPNYHPN
jgi:hypothetical protein